MEASFWTVMSASLAAAAVTALGIQTIRSFGAWANRYSAYFISFAAGVLIAVSFLHLIPRSFALSERAPLWLLTGFVTMHLFNRFVTAFVCERGPDTRAVIGLVPVVGIAIHSLIDGVVYSIAFTVSMFTGVLAALGMVLHEFPEGVITWVLLTRSGFADRTALLIALAAASVSTPIGTAISWPWISRVDAPLLGALLSLSAGSLIYVGATHLLPQAEQAPARYSLLALAGGILVAVVIVLAHAG